MPADEGLVKFVCCVQVRGREQPLIHVSHHNWAAESLQTREDGAWFWSERSDIAEADEVVEDLSVQLGEHRLQSEQIAMDIAYQPDPHTSSLTDRLCTRGSI
jgi:hypothetical protein